MQSTVALESFPDRPDRRLCVSAAAMSTIGPTGAIAILDTERGQFYSLNEVGGRVWELLREGTTFGAIVARLCGEYDAEQETIGMDVARLLEHLAAAGLVFPEAGDGDRGDRGGDGGDGGDHDER